MGVRTIHVQETSAAPVEAVWALVADVSTWSQWGGFDESELERPGSPVPEGVGALRRFRTGRVRNQEEVVRFDPPRGFSYEVRESDVPVCDYHADVDLTEAPGGGTTITWRSTFRARWPGTGPLVQWRLGAFIKDSARRLAAAAAQPSQSSPG